MRNGLPLDRPADRWDTGTEAALAAGRLDGAIRLALRSSVDGAEAPLAVWTRIRRRARRLRRALDGEGAPWSEASAEGLGRCGMFRWSDILAQQERYADLRREAETERLVGYVLEGRDGRPLVIRQALNWLGQRLVAWGYRMQERCGAAAAGVHPSACQPIPAIR